MKRIIVEGVDGSGKTSIIDKITESLNGVERVRGFNRQKDYPDYADWLGYQLNREPKSWIPIHDRFFYSELVYGPILRQRLAITPDIYNLILPRLRAEAFLIYCRPPFFTLLKSFEVEEQMEGVGENLAQLYDEYERVMMEEYKHYGLRFFLWDFSFSGNPDSLLDRVRYYLG